MNFEGLHKDIHFVLLISVIVLLPLNVLYCSYAIIALSINWIIEAKFKQKMQILKRRKLFLLIIALYLLYVVGLIYTQNILQGIFILEKRASLLALPLIIGSSSLRTNRVNILLKTFSITIFAYCLICYVNASLSSGKWFVNYTEETFYYGYAFTRFSFPSIINKIHPTYFSIYILTAITLLFHEFIISGRRFPRLPSVLMFLLFVVSLIILVSKTSIAIFFLLMFLFMIILILTGRIGKIGAITILLLSIICLGIILLNGQVKYRFLEEKAMTIEMKNEQWSSSLQIILNNPILGVGTGDSQDELNKIYKERNFIGSFKSSFNSHNEFLQMAITLGCIGLIAFVLNLFIPFYLSLKYKEYSYILFILIIGISSLTESILSTQKGVVLFSLINTLFLTKLYNLKERMN